MSYHAASFDARALTKACKAVEKTKFKPSKITIDPDGKIEILIALEATHASSAAQQWLDRQDKSGGKT